jgi:hypothetical protein
MDNDTTSTVTSDDEIHQNLRENRRRIRRTRRDLNAVHERVNNINRALFCPYTGLNTANREIEELRERIRLLEEVAPAPAVAPLQTPQPQLPAAIQDPFASRGRMVMGTRPLWWIRPPHGDLVSLRLHRIRVHQNPQPRRNTPAAPFVIPRRETASAEEPRAAELRAGMAGAADAIGPRAAEPEPPAEAIEPRLAMPPDALAIARRIRGPH